MVKFTIFVWRINMFDEFHEIYTKAFESMDLDLIPDKYLDTKVLYDRLYEKVLSFKDKGRQKGLDFGCGVGAATILGKLCDIDIVGVDIPFCRQESFPSVSVIKNPYTDVTDYLRNLGFTFYSFDTSVIPWTDFDDNEFDLLLSFNSLNDDYSVNSEKNHVKFNDDFMRSRLMEILRITTPDSEWHIGDNSKYRDLKKSTFYNEFILESDITLIGWS
jgi:SAM-dependent methyltransferase